MKQSLKQAFVLNIKALRELSKQLGEMSVLITRPLYDEQVTGYRYDINARISKQHALQWQVWSAKKPTLSSVLRDTGKTQIR